ncbi:S-adenosylmethionine tRNA ribosyltransferase [Candidatus Liberibacter solanacearum]|uniref:S-adenosylmethionine:tRNA ribosyltransferase-isomerase n=1 Tax=Candidatus Liberibacter solanacearum TaxID=556287 RepID=A0A095A0D3_9HYPH|nr:tRNA preQ1(34) S-adenosylmethionine ribosyltransferase-isomerase QueA [Candidatus Liberibacter solanacearum]KGB27576.1 S-adenosylmethionine tRNA ribosyltransferase [Candidatus Liberibacter solanacearum]KJZ80713.1 S-adenosylmethionine tRNA ribosyltransferase [Candidatus Liberibacter solanacearum]KJZ81803.1 S-adenosylmethionine:tRNA ribosyltransferase-isomerase [Candidatus Liberibacter solanacearum]KQC48859.1 S-adenosylmethionine:tRNA ribosyltransferase-isomerase [Candidatus Liberibacter solan
MMVKEFDFHLPSSRIALRPVSPRDSARLMVVYPNLSCSQMILDYSVRDLPIFLNSNDAIVFNNTKVIAAQLRGRRLRRTNDSEHWISCTLHMRISSNSWSAYVRPGKIIRQGDTIYFFSQDGQSKLEANVIEKRDTGEILLVFPLSGKELDRQIALIGTMPLPPYIAKKRPIDERDYVDYQTTYASIQGSVAAPTAGLHFTSDLLSKLVSMGVAVYFITLHVGAGTFMPVRVEDTDDHIMHSEIGFIDAQTAQDLNAVKSRGGRIVAVGTTSLRLLETATTEDGIIMPLSGYTNIFITPGYRFRAVDVLLSNFHLPKSTLLMLVSAFCGVEETKTMYQHAIANSYRFYSYGDASLIFKK